MTDTGVAVPVNLHEYEAAARALLSPMVCELHRRRSGDEVTLRANREAFGRWRLLPRVLRGAGEVSTATTVLGQPVALPVLIAPPGSTARCHPEGELATARAAKAAGTIYTLSTASNVAIEEIGPRRGRGGSSSTSSRTGASLVNWWSGPRRRGPRRSC